MNDILTMLISGERIVLDPCNTKSLILTYRDSRPVIKFDILPQALENNNNSLIENAFKSAGRHSDVDILQPRLHKDLVKGDDTEIVLT